MEFRLIQAGSEGDYESKLLEEGALYLAWSEIVHDLFKARSREAVAEMMCRCLPEAGVGKLCSHMGHVWVFCASMFADDWSVPPSKLASTIRLRGITGLLLFDADAELLFKQHRACRWIGLDDPRSRFGQDLPYSLNAFLTVCRISRSNAEARIRAIAANGWQLSRTCMVAVKPTSAKASKKESQETDKVPTAASGSIDHEQFAGDRIAQKIDVRFKRRGRAPLVEAILRAEVYITRRCPEGADHGVCILARSGAMGFGSPRICVQVKSGDSPFDQSGVERLVGTMQRVGCDRGLLVVWCSFESAVNRKIAQKFFRQRLWNQSDLIELVLGHCRDLGADVRAELPLKRIWAVAGAGEAA